MDVNPSPPSLQDEPMVEGTDFGLPIPSLATSSLTTHRQLANGVVEEDEIVFGALDSGDPTLPTGDQDEDDGHSPHLVHFEGLPQHPPELTVESGSKEVTLMEDSKKAEQHPKIFQSRKEAQEENAQYELVDCDDDEEEDGEHEYVYVWEECSTDESVETPPIPEHVTHSEELLDPSEYDVALEFDGSATSSDEVSSDEEEDETKQDHAGKQHNGVLEKPKEAKQLAVVPSAPLPTNVSNVDRPLADVGQDGPEPQSAPMEIATAPNHENSTKATLPVEANVFHAEPDSHDHDVSMTPVEASNGVVPLYSVDPLQGATEPDTMNVETALEELVTVTVNSADDPSPFGTNEDIEMGAKRNDVPLDDTPIQEVFETLDCPASAEREQSTVTKPTPLRAAMWQQNITLFVCFLLAGGVTVAIIFYLLLQRQ